jgi:hypothetical protein
MHNHLEMRRRLTIPFVLSLLCCPSLPGAGGVDLDQVKELALTYFRDSAEIPMNVDVTTTVMDITGKVKRRTQAAVVMEFNGYNQRSGRFSLRTNAGWLKTDSLHDSLSGDMAAFFAGGLIPKKDSAHLIEIQQAPEPDRPVLVFVKDDGCPQLDLMAITTFPRHPCGAAEFRLGAGPDGHLEFQHFSFTSSGDPSAAKVAYLGDVQLKAFHASVEFQEVYLPGDSKPYLWPKEAVTSATTDKGTVTISTRYSRKQ